MKAVTREWLNFAETDLQTCKKLIGDEFLTNVVSYHAQQTVEKCFKAILEENNMKIPKTHSIIRLSKAIEYLVSFEADKDLILMLDEIYIETRYPGEMGMFPGGKPSVSSSVKLYEFAEYIFHETKTTLE